MRRIRTLAACSVALLASVAFPSFASAQNCVAVPSGLVGWWPGNGNVEDVVAGNNGQLAGDAAFAAAAVGQGFKMDGSGDYVEIPDSAALRPTRVSVEAWVRFDSLTTPIVSQFGSIGLEYIVFKKNRRVFNFEGYALRKEREGEIDRLAFSVADINGVGGLNVAYSTTPIVVNEFYHVVGTYDGTKVQLYVNGALEGESAVSITLDYDTRPVFVGTSGETVYDGKLNGIVDEVSIYNRALDSSEIAALYAAGPAGKCSSSTGSISGLITLIQTLNISNGIANSLDGKLQNALLALDDANARNAISACNRLTAFLNEVGAQTGNLITSEQGRQLTTSARLIRTSLGCR